MAPESPIVVSSVRSKKLELVSDRWVMSCVVPCQVVPTKTRKLPGKLPVPPYCPRPVQSACLDPTARAPRSFVRTTTSRSVLRTAAAADASVLGCDDLERTAHAFARRRDLEQLLPERGAQHECLRDEIGGLRAADPNRNLK